MVIPGLLPLKFGATLKTAPEKLCSYSKIYVGQLNQFLSQLQQKRNSKTSIFKHDSSVAFVFTVHESSLFSLYELGTLLDFTGNLTGTEFNPSRVFFISFTISVKLKEFFPVIFCS